MSKSSFNALVEAKKQRDEVAETETSANKADAVETSPKEKKSAVKKDAVAPNTAETANRETNGETKSRSANKRETVRRSYRVEETHDKAIKIISKFMGQGTEEEIVLNIFAYYFENNSDGKKAIGMVGLLENK